MQDVYDAFPEVDEVCYEDQMVMKNSVCEWHPFDGPDLCLPYDFDLRQPSLYLREMDEDITGQSTFQLVIKFRRNGRTDDMKFLLYRFRKALDEEFVDDEKWVHIGTFTSINGVTSHDTMPLHMTESFAYHYTVIIVSNGKRSLCSGCEAFIAARRESDEFSQVENLIARPDLRLDYERDGPAAKFCSFIFMGNPHTRQTNERAASTWRLRNGILDLYSSNASFQHNLQFRHRQSKIESNDEINCQFHPPCNPFCDMDDPGPARVELNLRVVTTKIAEWSFQQAFLPEPRGVVVIELTYDGSLPHDQFEESGVSMREWEVFLFRQKPTCLSTQQKVQRSINSHVRFQDFFPKNSCDHGNDWIKIGSSVKVRSNLCTMQIKNLPTDSRYHIVACISDGMTQLSHYSKCQIFTFIPPNLQSHLTSIITGSHPRKPTTIAAPDLYAYITDKEESGSLDRMQS